MEVEIIVLYVGNPWSIVDDRTGEIREGISVHYYLNSTLETEIDEDGAMGMRVAKVSVPMEMKDSFVKAPAIYRAKMKYVVNSKGKTEQKLMKMEYVSDIEVKRISDKTKKEKEKEEKLPFN